MEKDSLENILIRMEYLIVELTNIKCLAKIIESIIDENYNFERSDVSVLSGILSAHVLNLIKKMERYEKTTLSSISNIV